MSPSDGTDITRPTTTVPVAEIVADLRGAAERWRRAGPTAFVASSPVAGLRAPRREAELARLAARAVEMVEAKACDPSTLRTTTKPGTADAVVVAKRPHLCSTRAIAATVARLLAFGVEVRGVTTITRDPEEVAAAIYPTAHQFFEQAPSNESPLWRALERRFGDRRFAEIFGQRYVPGLVLSGADVVRRFGLADAELSAIWEEGRRRLTRARMLACFGPEATRAVMADAADHDWFRGEWPFGIQRIGAGVMAFALRHERLGDAPVVILNGHFPGLVALFGPETHVIDIGIAPTGPQIADVRDWVTGNDNRPPRCERGSIRRDAADGAFPVDATEPVDSRMNLLHCSDGLLAGAIERTKLFGVDAGGRLIGQLREGGLEGSEVRHILMADPIIAWDDGKRLTDLTRGLDFARCQATLQRLVPPIFGEANMFAGGLRYRTFVAHVDDMVKRDGETSEWSLIDEDRRPLGWRPRHATELCDADRSAGLEALSGGSVGVLVPAAGTGGRFGGYGLAESDPRRQKALVAHLLCGGVPHSSLDIRAANARWWRARCGGTVPLAVMGGPANFEAIERWRARQAALGVGDVDIDVFEHGGAYRIRVDALEAACSGSGRGWVDGILRSPDGSPNVKPPGSLGVLTSLILSGVYARWREREVGTLVIGNADDVGFRIDPRIVGLMARESLDAVVVAVPAGFRASVHHAGCDVELRGDSSGWCIDDRGQAWKMRRRDDRHGIATDPEGRPVPVDTTPDVGGAVCEIWEEGNLWRPAIVESPAMRDPVPLDGFLNTGQLYLRAEALDGMIGGATPIEGAKLLVEALPWYAERKVVTQDGHPTTVVQLLQHVGDLVRRLGRVAVVRIDRWPSHDQRRGFMTMKHAADVVFAQLLLDRLAALGDELLFTTSPERDHPPG